MLAYRYGGLGWFGPDGFPVGPYKHPEENVKDDQITDCWEEKKQVWVGVTLVSVTESFQ